MEKDINNKIYPSPVVNNIYINLIIGRQNCMIVNHFIFHFGPAYKNEIDFF